MRKYGISREEEAALPQFKSHMEARAYFQEKYGESNFQMYGSEEVENEELYFYKLILNKEVYWAFQKMLREDWGAAMQNLTEEMMFSSQDIQIFESGRLHICH